MNSAAATTPQAIIKTFRYEIDMFINSCKDLIPSREISLVKTSLQRSKGWLGQTLKEMGESTPYPQSENATNPVIEPQAEHTKNTIWALQEWRSAQSTDRTAQIKFFRSQVEQKIKFMRTFWDGLVKEPARISESMNNPWAGQAYLQSLISLIDAKMWLGWELSEIRDSVTSDDATQEKSAPLKPFHA